MYSVPNNQKQQASDLFLAKTVQSQYIEQPNVYHREPSSEVYKNFLQDIKRKEDYSPIKGRKNFMGESIAKQSKNIVVPIQTNQHTGNAFRNNDEIKSYLKKLDTMLEANKQKYQENNTLVRKSESFEEQMENSSDLYLGKSRYLAENEGLKYLEKKYLTNEIKQKMNHSTALVKSGTFWNPDHENYQLGEVLCINCQEFINPEEIDEHSKICDQEMNHSGLSLLNDKIDNLKLLLIINYKNSPPEGSEEYIELENFVHIGTVIIDEIIHNNKIAKKIKENFEDLKELLKLISKEIKNIPWKKKKKKKIIIFLII